MRLNRVTFSGYRRFLSETTLKTSSKLTVLVGPNESGKSSVLKLLASFSDGSTWLSTDRHQYPEESGIKAKVIFDLSDEDKRAIGSNVPHQLSVTKDNNGRQQYELMPALKRPKEHRVKFKELLIRAVRSKEFQKVNNFDEKMYNEIVLFCEDLDVDTETYQSSDHDFFNLVHGVLAEFEKRPLSGILYVSKKSMPQFLELEEKEHPNELALRIVRERIPRFIEFTERDRELDPTFNFSEFQRDSAKNLADTNQVFQNLCEISKFDIVELHANYISNRSDRITTQVDRSNRNLKRIFSGSWSQSDVILQFSWQKPLLEILALTEENEKRNFSLIRERSDGFRQYVALLVFVIRENAHNPILLIDEAEQHLHYDAQADLIQTFIERKLASQMIYTTHSAGCLPEDLGVGQKYSVSVSYC